MLETALHNAKLMGDNDHNQSPKSCDE